jgi:replication factor C subunit 3/5
LEWLSQILFALLQASKADIPHMMFYGCSGAGKKTRVMAFLRAVFGSGVEKVGEIARAHCV